MPKPASIECRKLIVGQSPKNEDDLRRMRARLWHDEGILVLQLGDIPNEFDRQRTENLGNQLYGKRGVA